MLNYIRSILVTDWLFLMMFPVILTGKSCLLAWEVQETSPLSTILITQSKRYKYNILSLIISVTFSWLTLAGFGLNAVLAGLSQWRQTGLIGWIISILVYAGAAIPFIALVNMVHIYRNPAQLGRRYVLFGSYRFWAADGLTRTAYFLTEDIRTAKSAKRLRQAFELRAVVPVKYVDRMENPAFISLTRMFVYANNERRMEPILQSRVTVKHRVKKSIV